jgi:hypothetical protein
VAAFTDPLMRTLKYEELHMFDYRDLTELCWILTSQGVVNELGRQE